MISNTSQYAIETTGLTKHFKDSTALSNLNLGIEPGTAFGFIGPNGAGKTTTIKMLMGVLRISAGHARVLSHDPVTDALAIKGQVGYVPEQQFIYRWMRVNEAIAFCSPLYPSWNDRLCAELLKRFELNTDKRVGQLSKGMVAKLSLVLALSHEPELLILDEPMAGLDALAREEFLDGILQTLCDRKQTILFSSHILDDVQRIADKIGIIDQGELLVQSNRDELLKGTKRIRAVLTDGAAPENVPDGTIWQRVRQREWLLTVKDFSEDSVDRLRAGNRVENVEVIDLGLEDIFKDFIKGRRTPV